MVLTVHVAYGMIHIRGIIQVLTVIHFLLQRPYSQVERYIPMLTILMIAVFGQKLISTEHQAYVTLQDEFDQ